MMFSSWSELVLYLEGIVALCVQNEELTQVLTLCFHLQYFCLFVDTRVQLLECIFVISKRLTAFDRRCRRAHEVFNLVGITPMLTLCSFVAFWSVRGYSCISAGVHFCDF